MLYSNRTAVKACHLVHVFFYELIAGYQGTALK